MIGEEFDGVLERAQGGSEEAFERLWRDTNPVLLRYLSLCGDPAEDIAAETWASVVKGLRKFRGDESAWRGWVFTTARRRAVDAARRRTRDGLSPGAPVPHDAGPAVRDCAEDALESLGTQAALRLVASLPPLQAEIVLLRVVAGLPVEAVARIVGRSAGAVRVAAHRGLRQLAENLGGHEGAGATADSRAAVTEGRTARPRSIWASGFAPGVTPASPAALRK